MTNLFIDLNRHRVESLAITEFNEQFGIPSQLGCKLLARALHSSKEWLKVVTIICNDAATQSYYMEKIVNFKDRPSISSFKSGTDSNYY